VLHCTYRIQHPKCCLPCATLDNLHQTNCKRQITHSTRDTTTRYQKPCHKRKAQRIVRLYHTYQLCPPLSPSTLHCSLQWQHDASPEFLVNFWPRISSSIRFAPQHSVWCDIFALFYLVQADKYCFVQVDKFFFFEKQPFLCKHIRGQALIDKLALFFGPCCACAIIELSIYCVFAGGRHACCWLQPLLLLCQVRPQPH
jgi:hypothetical protein